MRRQRKAKIVATLGPASTDRAVIAALFAAGVDVFRLNLSHGNHDDHRRWVQCIRELEDEHSRPLGILADIQGPKLRLGAFQNGRTELINGRRLRLDLDPAPGDARRVCLPHAEIFQVLQVGCELALDDGRVRVRVLDCGAEYATTEVIVGGVVSDHKGVNVPGVVLPLTAITDKDREDLRHVLRLEVDWIAQSFVQEPDDLRQLRDIVGDRAKIMAKLEKPSALKQLDEILALCDAVMVARGDLGVELPPQRVPVVQKQIVRRCRRAGKPVIVATHMLDSMVSHPAPTRAEASDVATAIYDGVDAVMLSAESAVGDYPVESVAMMNDIIREVESDPAYNAILDAQRPEPEHTTADAICNAVQQVTEIVSSTTTVTYTASGSTALRAARERPHAPILGLTPFIKTARYLALTWGVHAVTVDVAHADADINDVIAAAKAIAAREHFAAPGEPIVIAAGLPFGHSGTTNLLHIAWV